MKDLLSINQLEKDEIWTLMKQANRYASNLMPDTLPLRGTWMSTLFYEPSTRTRCSFEVAARRLGAELLPFDVQHSSVLKGESLYDTLRTLEALGVQAAVVRQGQDGLLQEVADQLSLHIINAGDGSAEHPSQALLDLYTIWQHFGHVEGLNILIAGDILHSRVAHSNLLLLQKLGANVMVSGPTPFVTPISTTIPQLNSVPIVDFDEYLEKVDVVMMLRIQNERHQDLLGLEQEEYHQCYGLTRARYARLQENAILMHPGPINRGVELDTILVEAEKSKIFTQMENGVFVRMAILEYLLTGGVSHVHLAKTSKPASA
ncbi:aspartate carbamoyltransferase catalytic subunit [Rubeoparvulum massiliense]|uniref:aspartate carbamoyltransferase catalytic subunit n=1 Tax=Rubeoparvulum massiliense TaxID=1631346 RepID=UPI00065DE76F|nr:aspartate carbamoyltransferase catalytic subunit [Rubeoparvulum massiliense]